MAILNFFVDTASAGGDGTTSALTGVHAAYSSLGAALSANAANLTSTGNNVVFHCAASTGVTDTTSIDFTGWTANSTNFITIQVDQANRHAGVWDSSKYSLDPNVYNIFGSDTPSYTRLIGLQLMCGHYDDRNLHGINLGGSNHGIQVLACIFRWKQYARTYGNGCASIFAGVDQTGDPTIVANCLFYQHYLNGEQTYADAIIAVNANVVAFNNTFIGVGQAFTDGYSRVKVVNCLVSGSTSFGNPAATGCDYNATDLGTATGGAHDRVSQTFTFVAAASFNYQLDSTDAGAKAHGTDLSSDSTFPVTTDIAGTTRTSPFDIGAFRAVGVTSTPATVSPSGVFATAGRGVTTERASANKAPSGVSASAINGTTGEVGTARINPSGVQSNASVGSVSISAVAASVSVTVNPAGVQATTQTGTVGVAGNENSYPNGIQVNTAVGSGIPGIDSYPACIGQQSSAVVGSVAVHGNENSYPAGVQAWSQVGIASPSLSGNVSLNPIGVQASAQIGILSLQANSAIPTAGSATVTNTHYLPQLSTLNGGTSNGINWYGDPNVSASLSHPHLFPTDTASFALVTGDSTFDQYLRATSDTTSVDLLYRPQALGPAGLFRTVFRTNADPSVFTPDSGIIVSANRGFVAIAVPVGSTAWRLSYSFTTSGPLVSGDVALAAGAQTLLTNGSKWVDAVFKVVVDGGLYDVQLFVDEYGVNPPGTTLAASTSGSVTLSAPWTPNGLEFAVFATSGRTAGKLFDLAGWDIANGYSAGTTQYPSTQFSNADYPTSGGGGSGISGSQAVAQIGAVSAAASATMPVVGVQVVASAGTVAVVAVSGFLGATVPLVGVQANTATGIISPQCYAQPPPVGQSCSSATGTPSVAGNENSYPAGVQATVVIGSAVIQGCSSTAVNGVQVSAQTGTDSISATANAFPVGIQTIGQVGTVSIGTAGNVVPNVSGVSLSASIGSVTLQANANEYANGVAATGQVGSLTDADAANVFATGVQANTAVGAVTIGTLSAVTVTPTGVQATYAIGVVAVVASANENSTGVQCSGNSGTSTVNGSGNVYPSGVEASGQVGNVFDYAAENVWISGVEADTIVGQASIIAITYARPSGVEADASVGALTEVGTANVPASGVIGSIGIGTINSQGNVNAGVTGVQAIGQIGQVTDADSAVVSLAGVEADTRIGTVTFGYLGPAIVSVTGVEAHAQVGIAYVPGGRIEISVVGVEADFQPIPSFCLAIINNVAVDSPVVNGGGGPRHGGGVGTFLYQPPKKPSVVVAGIKHTLIPRIIKSKPRVTVSRVRQNRR